MFACKTFWNSTIFAMHTWAYKRNEKVHFWLHLNIGKKRLAAFLLRNIFIAIVSACLSHLRAQYSVQLPDIFSSKQILYFSTHLSVWGDCAFALLALNTNSFAAVENISMRFCVIQAHRWKFSSQHFRNENFSVFIKMQTERSGQSKN